jgi:hypothetical protein
MSVMILPRGRFRRNPRYQGQRLFDVYFFFGRVTVALV